MADKEKSVAKEDPKSLLIWVLGVIAILGLVWFFSGGYDRAKLEGIFIKPLAPVDTGETYGDVSDLPDKVKNTSVSVSSGSVVNNAASGANSTWAGKVNIEKGSASSAIQPADEYIIIKNVSKTSEPINISGWTLKNAGVVSGGSGILRGSQKSVIIPQGVYVLRPGQANTLAPIILQKGERAVVTSGKIGITSPYPINYSFKTNICTGYLDRLPYYNFKPSLPAGCPDSEKEVGVESLDDTCFKLVKGLGRCETPEFKFDSEYGEELVDGKLGISSACKNFLKAHYNYLGCLTFHSNDSNFAGKEWRVFLSGLPLWAKDRETIFLYDSTGRLVDSLSY